MKKIFLALVLLLAVSSTFSQINLEKFTDSVKKIPVDKFITLSTSYLFKTEYESQMKILSDVILKKIADKKLNENQLIYAYRVLYLNYYHNNEFEETIKYGKLSEIASKKLNSHHFECLANIILGQSYFELGDYDVSINYHIKALKIATAQNIINLKIATKANIGKFKLACNDFNGAIEILEKSIEETEDNKTAYLKGFYPETYSDLTLAYVKTNNLKKAKECNIIGKKYAKKFNYYLNVNLMNEAIIEMHKKNYDKALKIIDSTNSIVERTHDKFNFVATQHLNKGKIYFYKKEYTNALKELLTLEKLENTKRINNLNFQEGFSLIAKTYAALNKNDFALKYYKKALATFTETQKKKVELISKITDKYDENQINQILKNKNLLATEFIHKKHSIIEKEIQKLNSEKQEKNIFILIIVAVFLLLITTFGFVTFKSRKKNKQKVEQLLARISEKETTFKKNVKTNTELNLKDSEIERILNNLKDLEKNQFYLNTNCTAANLSKKLKTNTTYLSKIINHHYQKSFTNYINDLRIDYVLNRLKKDKLFRRYSIQSIANEIGFKSRESFNKVFKKETGILPSYFIKELNKNS
ncbi:AraC family transcriptional regulator [Polaribacter porphyrae]|uniref:HTH araC/xylS-type domain-containing protein n=1 Tax=Polaribacter porphyrae TaxID=1137780 RepID=A0A2S7WR93_9FLAO|nr:AraC family transcriptional regulator [Polaribacter porphyrae]PQJ80109.1 hypothetical protein BTO18_13405 [Polaribacter porphyrae]